jgi:hypothetical protein
LGLLVLALVLLEEQLLMPLILGLPFSIHRVPQVQLEPQLAILILPQTRMPHLQRLSTLLLHYFEEQQHKELVPLLLTTLSLPFSLQLLLMLMPILMPPELPVQRRLQTPGRLCLLPQQIQIKVV